MDRSGASSATRSPTRRASPTVCCLSCEHPVAVSAGAGGSRWERRQGRGPYHAPGVPAPARPMPLSLLPWSTMRGTRIHQHPSAADCWPVPLLSLPHPRTPPPAPAQHAACGQGLDPRRQGSGMDWLERGACPGGGGATRVGLGLVGSLRRAANQCKNRHPPTHPFAHTRGLLPAHALHAMHCARASPCPPLDHQHRGANLRSPLWQHGIQS